MHIDKILINNFKNYNFPDKNGHFNQFGGAFVPETLVPALQDLCEKYNEAKNEATFRSQLDKLLKHYSGRKTPLYFAERISNELGFNGNECNIIKLLTKQSPDIQMGVDRKEKKNQGAGDQGLMFGYATNETESLMPSPIYYSHRLVEKQTNLLKTGAVSWLRPDAKSQVTFQYEKDKPTFVDTVVLSTQHSSDISLEDLREYVKKEIIFDVIPENLINDNTNIFINPTGNFVEGGPLGDSGLTGRKIIVDTYGGMARHGGGAFSGKDPSKVDRSAAYAARYIAKNIVAAGLADRCEIQISYAIGVAQPTSTLVNTFGTGTVSDDKLSSIINDIFDLTPYGIITTLNLLDIKYKPTAGFGHFGRNDVNFTWEQTDKVDILRSAI